jgi:hypothetical protein
MVIDTDDIQSIVVNLNAEQTGDMCDIVLANPNNKYDELIQWDNRYAKSLTIKMGYSSSTVSVFTGRVFISNKDKEAGQNDTLKITLLERNALFENAPMLSERITNTTLKDLVSLCAQKYLGYSAGEITVVDPGNYFDSAFCNIGVFDLRNESLIKKLRDIATGFGGALYNDADGNLVLRKLYDNTTPDITYEMEHWLKWGIKTNLRNECPNEIEIIGREKQIDEIVNTDHLCILGKSVEYAEWINSGHTISFLQDKNSIQKLLNKKGDDYVAKDGNPSLLMNTGQLKLRRDENGYSQTDDWFICEVPFIERWGIPTEAECKYFAPQNIKDAGEKVEVWEYGDSINMLLLGWDKEKATYLVWNLPRDGNDKLLSRSYLFLAYGYAADDRYVSLKSQSRWNEIWAQNNWEEVKQPFTTNYYSRRILKDPVSGKRLSEYTGVIKKETVDLPWVDTDAQSYQVYYNKANVAWFRTRPFTLTVPVNPLIERGDLVRVELDETYWCEFWVESITHEYSKSATTTLNGYIYQSQLPYDPPVTI